MKASKPTPIKHTDAPGKRAAKPRRSAALHPFYVPGRGKVMAASIDDIANQLSDKSREEGDGNS